MKKPDQMPEELRKSVRELNDQIVRLKQEQDSAKLHKERIQFIKTLATKAAEGDIKSFEMLVQVASAAVDEVQQLTKTNLVMAVTVAQHVSSWPISLSPGQQMSVEQKQLVKRLDLASKDGLPFKTSKVNENSNTSRILANLLIRLTVALQTNYSWVSIQTISTTATEEVQVIASDSNVFKLFPELNKDIQTLLRGFGTMTRGRQFHIDGLKHLVKQLSSRLKCTDEIPFDQLLSYSETASNLPTLTKESSRAWFEFGKQLVLLFTHDRPEDNTVLRKLGAYRMDAYYRKDVNTRKDLDARKRTAKAKATENSNIRDGIFQRLKSAYPVVMKAQ